MPVKMNATGKKNPDGFREKFLSQNYGSGDIDASSSGGYKILEFDCLDVDFDRDDSTVSGIGSPSYKSSGIQIYSMTFTLENEPGAIVGVQVQRVEEDAPVTVGGIDYTYLKYHVTLIIDPSITNPNSNQLSITVGAPTPPILQTSADFYFSELEKGESVAIAGSGLLEGTSTRDCLNGGNGTDTLQGKDDNDYMVGGLGSDSLDGGDGNDFLNGFGTKASPVPQFDTLVGGNGADTFVLSAEWGVFYVEEGDGYAIIKDWSAGEDKIQVQDIAKGTYSLETKKVIGNPDIEDTEIYFTDANGFKDRIAIVKDTTDVDAPYAPGNFDLVSYLGNFLEGGLSNDALVGTGGKDTLNGFGTTASSASQIDTLVGGGGSDTFVLGGNWGVSYVEVGDGYAVIKDWDVNQDYIRVKTVPGGTYSLDKFRNVTGSGAKDTEIYFTDSGGNKDRIGIVQDTTNVQIGRDFQFV